MTRELLTNPRSDRAVVRWKLVFVFLLAVGVFTFFGLRYLSGTLSGNTNWHILSSVVFGPPDYLKSHGLEPLYTLKEDGGWDGQQYYFAANDVLDEKGTSDYLDGARAIRYQRIGLGVASNITSMVLGHDWVTPKDFLFTNILIIFAGLAALLIQWGRHGCSFVPAIAIFLSPILYLSAFNGLLDAAADALFIIFVVSILRGGAWAPFAFVSGALCVLTREAYVLAFAVFFAIFFVLQILHDNRMERFTRYLTTLKLNTRPPGYWRIGAPLFSIFAFCGWLLWLRLHFNYWPSSKAGAVVDTVPLRSLLANILATANGTPRVVSSENIHFEFGSLLVFSIVMFVSVILNSVALVRQFSNPKKMDLERCVLVCISVVGITFFVLYTFFGNTVMEHYTGYIKPLGLLLLSISTSLYLGNFRRVTVFAVTSIIVVGVIWVDFYMYRDRLKEQFPHHFKEVVSQSGLTSTSQMSCLPENSVLLEIEGIKDTNRKPLLRDLLGLNRFLLLDVAVTNKSNQAIDVSSKDNLAAVFLVGEVTEQNSDASTSWKSVIRRALQNNEKANYRTMIEVPAKFKASNFRVKLVQPSCSDTPIFITPTFSYGSTYAFGE